MVRSPNDDVVLALVELVAQIERTTEDLGTAGQQARRIIACRAEGRPWHEIIRDEERPLIIERVSQALVELGVAGNRVRRAQAHALLHEGVRVTDIGRLFGVSRQRVSALLDDVPDDLRRRRLGP